MAGDIVPIRTHKKFDQQARDIALRHTGCSDHDREIRRELAELCHRAGLVNEVFKWDATRTKYRDFRGMDLEEAVAVVTATIVEKILVPDAPSSLNLEAIANGSSFAGWVRQLASKVASSKSRPDREIAHRDASFILNGDTADGKGTPCYTPDFDHDAVKAELCLDSLDVFPRLSVDCVREKGRLLRVLYGVPKLRAPRDLFVLYMAREVLALDQSQAMDSLVERNTPRRDKVLSPLWDDYTDEDAQRVVEASVLSRGRENCPATVLLQEVLAVPERPSDTVYRRCQKLVEQWCDRPEWVALSRGLLASYFAVAFTPIPRNAPFAQDSVKRSRLLQQRHWEAGAWQRRVADTSIMLGVSVGDVVDRLSGLTDFACETGFIDGSEAA